MQALKSDFGPEADAAIDAACAQFPATFELYGHAGTFRVSRRASYASRGQVLVYTQMQWTPDRFAQVYGRAHRNADELWCDFAKGTVAELRGQIK